MNGIAGLVVGKRTSLPNYLIGIADLPMSIASPCLIATLLSMRCCSGDLLRVGAQFGAVVGATILAVPVGSSPLQALLGVLLSVFYL